MDDSVTLRSRLFLIEGQVAASALLRDVGVGASRVIDGISTAVREVVGPWHAGSGSRR
jgi:hypothetical protein